MDINDTGIILQNLILGFLSLTIGFYVLAAILEAISGIFKIHVSIFDFSEYFISKVNEKIIIINSSEMFLQKWVGKIYSAFIEVILWVIPIACAVTAGILLKGFHWVILGFIAGIVLDVILNIPVVILLNIRSSLKNIKDK